jgi:tetratricopeptide (TPR) repeat protein/tRNA A-37 threonylcarbamoyl transferase component Bud32
VVAPLRALDDRAVVSGSSSAEPTIGDEDLAPVEEDARGRIGRYVLLERIGAGGVGIVYAAWDPVLARRVALKLLRHGTSESQERLVREAQAMARLSHPHVVQVFDAGVVDERAFVAMDFVDGGTLRAWLKEARPQGEILDVFLQAARGLAAAHAASLVHRDFKPDNVLLGRLPDGRVRAMVADFGLVRVGGEIPEPAASLEKVAQALGTTSDERLTNTGAVMGTPAYMAPEQFLGRGVDGRSDQFAFCVALFEALFGARPFAGEGVRSLALAVMQGQRAPIPTGVRVPAILQRVVERGLATDPAARHASMDDLIDALSRARAGRRIGRIVAIAIPVALGLGWAAMPASDVAAAPCTGTEAPIDAQWNADRRAAVAEAFTRTELPYADEAAEVATRDLDAWAQQWADARRDACEATAVRKEQSAELLDRRMACLDRRLGTFAAIVEILGAADRAAVQRATSVATHLPDLRPCSDAAALLAPIAPPDASIAAEVAQVREGTDRARAEIGLGRAAGACPALLELSLQAEPLGYVPLNAEVALARGYCESETADTGARVTLERALLLGIEARDDVVASEAARHLAFLLGVRDAAHADGRRHAELSRALARDASTPRADARLALTEAQIEFSAGEFRVARESLARAREIGVPAFGERSAWAAMLENTAGAVELRAGSYALAQAAFERAVAIAEDAHGRRHPDVALALNNLALALERQARYPEAIAALERAREILAGAHGEADPRVGQVLHNLGGLALQSGDPKAAIPQLEQGIEVMAAALGPSHPILVGALTMLGEASLELQRHAEARTALERAIAIREEAVGRDHPDLALPLVALARLDLDEGQLERAHASIERAARVLDGKESDPEDRGALAFVHAEVLASLGRDVEAAARADEAKALLDSAGPTGARRLARLHAWKASLRAR